MSITEKIKNRVAEKTYDTATHVSRLAFGDCLFLVWYEPEFIDEMIGEEEEE